MKLLCLEFHGKKNCCFFFLEKMQVAQSFIKTTQKKKKHSLSWSSKFQMQPYHPLVVCMKEIEQVTLFLF